MLAKKDYFSIEVLAEFGGVFLDMDYICVKSFDELVYRYSFFGSLEPPMSHNQIASANVGIIGASAQHEIIKLYREKYIKYYDDYNYRIEL